MRAIYVVAATSLVLAACVQHDPPPIMSSLDPAALQAMQTRNFATPDRSHSIRQVIATLQDLGYGIDKVDAAEGSITATKSAFLTMTATVAPPIGNTTSIRADAIIRMQQQPYEVDDPSFYAMDFFGPLSRNLALASATTSPAPAYGAPPYVTPETPAAAPSDGGWHATPSP